MRSRPAMGRVLLVALALMLGTEAALRLGAARLWLRPDRVELVSAPLLRDRLRVLETGGPGLAFLGDSVAYGSALREHGDPLWREHTPPALLRRDWAARGARVNSFAADGLYPLDLEALAAAALSLSPTAVVVELNYRMLDAESGAPGSALARPFLRDWLPPDRRPPAKDGPWPGRAPAEGLRNGWVTWRYMELLSYLSLLPSLRDVMDRQAARFFAPAGEDAAMGEGAEALLQMKIRPYYQASARRAGHLGWQSLERLAGTLRASGLPCLVFLTPQNRAVIDPVLDDRGAWASNRAELARIFRPGGGLVFRDWADRMPELRFLDHCHLDTAGNGILAGWIGKEVDLAR